MAAGRGGPGEGIVMGGFRGEPTPPRTPPRYLWVPPPVLSWPRRAPSRPIDHHSPTSIPLLLSQPPPTTRSPTVDLPPPPPPPKPIDPPKTPPPVGSVLWALLESRRPSPRRAFMWGGNPPPMTSFPPPPLGVPGAPPRFPRIVPQMPLNVTVTRNPQLSG